MCRGKHRPRIREELFVDENIDWRPEERRHRIQFEQMFDVYVTKRLSVKAYMYKCTMKGCDFKLAASRNIRERPNAAFRQHFEISHL